MTQHEFSQIIQSLPALSPEQLARLRSELDNQLTAAAQPAASDEALQRRLLEAGIVSDIKPPIRDLTPYQHRKAVPISGEPLSETIIRERR